ncbi:MAG: hypothetical protein H7Y18_07985 [Clostridiaceae bacterium]|nr:hypothetical protein [Clostridiaceae bacterium]
MESFSQKGYTIRELQNNNKPVYGLFHAMLHYHNPYIAKLYASYGASPGTKYPHSFWLLILFKLPKLINNGSEELYENL